MGIFDFLKDSGAKIHDIEKGSSFHSSSLDTEKRKKESMIRAVDKLNLPVKNLSLDIQNDTVVVYGQAETQVAKELVILTLGNNMGVSRVDDRMTVVKPEVESAFYEVKKGDTLSKIAKTYYGDAMKYNIIFEANKPMLKDPDLIYPGQKLRIPRL